VGLFADGVAVREVGEETFRLCQQYVDEIILVIRMTPVRDKRRV
jgi:threonine dehydratase